MQPTTPFLSRMKLRGYRQMAGQLRPTSVWSPMTSRYYQTGQSLLHWPTIICPPSSPSNPNCPRLMDPGEPTSTSRKRTGKRYADACDKYLAEAGETRTVEQAEKTFRKAVCKASGLFNPAGRIQHFQPTLPASAKSLVNERDRKRVLNPSGETLYDLNKQIQKLVVEDKRTKWQSAVDKCDHRTGISHLWRLVMGLCGKQPHNTPNKGVRFVDKTYPDQKMIANKFAHQFTPSPIRFSGDKSKRQLKRQFHQLPLTGTPSFTPADTREAIRLAKSSTAIGPDGMSTLHLKKLAQGAINYLTNIFNLTISTG